jgi:putative membrane protein
MPIESPPGWMFVHPREDAEVPSRGRFGARVGGRTVAAMNTLNAVTSVVGSHGEHDGFWFPFGLLWLALIGAGIWFLVRGGRFRRPPSGMEQARDILAERFARGELTGEEYRERLEQLR